MVIKFRPSMTYKKIFNYDVPKPIVYVSVIGTVTGCACIIKDWAAGKKFKKDVDLEGKVIIVTGGNTGIGKETAWEMARRHAKVYLACRDMRKCEKTREKIVMDTKNKYVYCRQCDLASLDSIRKFVTTFKTEEKQLHILINNAGVMRTPKDSKTKDGFELQLGVNHLGHFLLTNLLLDTLKESAPSRIVNVSSIAHVTGKINKEDLNSTKNYRAGDAYAQSKLANIMFTQELSKILGDTKVTVNAVHPGIVDTDLIRHMSFFNSWIAAITIKPFIWPFIKSACAGAQTVIYAAIEPDIANVTGKYFRDNVDTPVGPVAQDESTSKWLWTVSEKWTHLHS